MPRLTPVMFQQLLDHALNGPARYTIRHHFTAWQSLVFALGAVAAELVAIYLVFVGIFTFIRNAPANCSTVLRWLGLGEKDAPHTFLELIFPVDTTKSAFATEQLHILLPGIVKYNGAWDRLAARKKPYSYELVGTNDDGIRFILMVTASEADSVRRTLLSFLPGLKVREVEDYAAALPSEQTTTIELQLNGDFVIPLKSHKALDEHDPMAYLTGHMTKLLPDELVAYQIVAVPVLRGTHHRAVRRQRRIEARIALGKEVWSQIKPQRSPLGHLLWLLWYPPLWLLGAMGKLTAFAGGLVVAMVYPELEMSRQHKDKRRPDNPYDKEMMQLVKSKLDQQLFEVTLRILVSSPDAATHYSRINALIEAFRPFRTSYQVIGTRPSVPLLSSRSKLLEGFKARTLASHHLSQQTILSSSELADLYHFPNTDLVKTEGFVKSRSRELSSPLSINRSDAKLDVIVGLNTHGGKTQSVGMTLPQRQKHTYIIGKTGTGKTTMLTNMIHQDMVNGKGLAVLDPHGDMFRELLQIVPKNRQADVVIFDPSDRAYPPGLNVFEPGIDFTNPEDGYSWTASAIVSTFAKLAQEQYWGPRMEHILRSAVLTTLRLPDPSFYTLQRLLTDKRFQRQAAAQLQDPILKAFWQKEMIPLGDTQLAGTVAPLTHRIGHFITDPMSRHILLQPKSTVRLSEIMNEGKMLLVNLSKGDIGEDQSFFFGTLLTSLIWTAAYQRIKRPEHQRRDFFVYIDEFQNFAAPRFAEIASEGRKFHVSLTLSHQNVSQIEDEKMLNVMVGNAHTLICLKANPDDEAFILPYMEPVVQKGDIVNLAPHRFFMKTTADESEDAFSGETMPLDTPHADATARAVIESSRAHFAISRKQAEQIVDQLTGSNKPTEKPQTGTPKKAVKAAKIGL